MIIKLRNENGFTLIEMLIVILIIGILAVIALPQYRRVTERARAMEAVQTVKMISDALERYYLTHSDYSILEEDSWLEKLDIDVNLNGELFSFKWYKNVYVAMTRKGKDNNRYVISKTFNPDSNSAYYARGLTCNILTSEDNGTFASQICKDLCGVTELTKVWGSGELGCKIQF